jgi:hypothetical protein
MTMTHPSAAFFDSLDAAWYDYRTAARPREASRPAPFMPGRSVEATRARCEAAWHEIMTAMRQGDQQAMEQGYLVYQTAQRADDAALRDWQVRR